MYIQYCSYIAGGLQADYSTCWPRRDTKKHTGNLPPKFAYVKSDLVKFASDFRCYVLLSSTVQCLLICMYVASDTVLCMLQAEYCRRRSWHKISAARNNSIYLALISAVTGVGHERWKWTGCMKGWVGKLLVALCPFFMRSQILWNVYFYPVFMSSKSSFFLKISFTFQTNHMKCVLLFYLDELAVWRDEWTSLW